GRKPSDYGRQLREKQKVKRIYGIMENQFKRYYQEAAKTKGVTGEALLSHLERRLDNVVYRLGFAPTRAAARQIVRHGHVKVSDRRVDIPSFEVSIGHVVSLKPKSVTIPAIEKSLAEKTHITPGWLQKKATAGKITAYPKREDIIEDIQEQLIVEYYSR
ncbi:MAG: 30S ribosomal protein S4, partial [Candidatus Roizmanbacteria bacterium]|nr:30S ribosomal protein S4 [Candidatus Roizmanbacteria bacterium]